MNAKQDLYNFAAQANVKGMLEHASDRRDKKMIVAAFRWACDSLEAHFHLSDKEDKLNEMIDAALRKIDAKRQEQKTAREKEFARVKKIVQKANEENFPTRTKGYPKIEMPRTWKRLISKDCPHGHSEWWLSKKGTKVKLRYRKLNKEYGVQAVLEKEASK